MKPLEDQTVVENCDAEFVCKVYPADCPLNWRVNGKPVQSDFKYTISSQGAERLLVIKDVKEEEECVVSAVLEETDSQANLWVEGMPITDFYSWNNPHTFLVMYYFLCRFTCPVQYICASNWTKAKVHFVFRSIILALNVGYICNNRYIFTSH